MKNSTILKAFMLSLFLHSVIFFVNYPGGNLSTSYKVNTVDGLLVRIQSNTTMPKLRMVKPVLFNGNKSNFGNEGRKLKLSHNEFDNYIDSKNLDVHPTPVHEVMIDPLDPSESNESGYVVMYVYINQYGQVKKIDVDESTIPSALEQAAILAFTNAMFNPGEINSKVVATKMKIKIDFFDR